jgi:predicted dinucleotide-binding enzyme
MIDALLIGGKGNIGAGLRTYLPQLDSQYRITSIELPGAVDKAKSQQAQSNFIEFDVSTDGVALRKALEGRDLVV